MKNRLHSLVASRRRRIALIFILSILTIFAAASLFLHSPYFKRFLIRKLNSNLQSKSQLSLAVEEIQINIFKLSADLKGVQVKPVSPGAGALQDFSARRIFVNVTLSTLLSGNIHIQKLEVIEPRVILGQLSPAKKEAGVKRKPFQIRIDELDLESGMLEFANKSYPVEGSLKDIVTRIRYEEGSKRHRGEISTQAGTIIFSQSSFPVDALKAEFYFDNRNAELDSLVVRVGTSSLEARGWVRDFQAVPSFELEMEGSLDIDQYQALIPLEKRVEGQFHLEATAQGEGETLVYSGRLEGRDISLNDSQPVNIQADFEGTEKTLTVSRFSGNAAGGSLEGRMNLSLLSQEESSLHLDWKDINIEDLAAVLPSRSPVLSSRASGTLEARWLRPDPKEVTASGQISLSPPPKITEKMNVLRGNLRFNVSDGKAEVQEGRLSVNGDILTLSGQLDPARNLKADFLIRSKDLSATQRMVLRWAENLNLPLPRESGEIPLGGQLSLSGKIAGTLESPAASFSARLENGRFRDEDVSLIEVRGTYKNNRLSLDEFVLHKGDGTVTGNMGLNLADKSYSLHLAAEDIDLTDLNSLSSLEKKVSGKLRMKLDGEGTFHKPKFTLGCTVEDVKGPEMNLGRVVLEADSDGDTARMRLDVAGLKTVLQMKAPLEEPLTVHGEFITSDLKIEQASSRLLKNGLPPVSTNITARGSFVLPVDRAEALTADLKVEQARLSYKDLWLENKIPIHLTVERGSFEIKEFSLAGSNTEFLASGSIPLKAEFGSGGQVKVDGLINFQLLQPFIPEAGLEGIASIHSTVTGSLDRPVLSTTLKLKRGRLSHPRIPISINDISLDASVDERAFELKNFSAKMDGGNLSARGQVALSSLPPGLQAMFAPSSEEVKTGIEATFSGIDLGKFFQQVKSPAGELGGTVEGRLFLGGSFGEIGQVEMQGEVVRLEISSPQLAMANPKPVKFQLKQGVFSLDEFQIRGEKASVQGSGRLSLFPEPEVEAHIKAEVNSSVLSLFVPDAAMEGTAALDINFRGTPQSPQVSGQGKFKNGFIKLSAFSLEASSMDADLEFTESLATLNTFQGILNGGPLQVSGTVHYPGFKLQSADFTLSAKNIQLNSPEGFSGRINASLSLGGAPGTWTLGGDVELLQAFYGRDVYPGSQVFSAIRSRRPRMAARPEMLQNIRLDLRAATVDSFVIDNNLASLELAGDVRISGTLMNPILSGRVSNRYPGELVFGNNRYQVERATVDFTGTERLDPSLSLVARTGLRHEYDDLQITLTLSGPLSRLDYSLSSSPPRSEEELASLLITGYGLNKIKDQGTNVIGDQLLLYFASPLAHPLAETLRKALGVEEVYIEPINIATEADPGARFTFRKKVTGQADIVYSVDVSDTQRQTWMLDYSLGRNFTIRSFKRDDGSYGSSFRHRFGFDPMKTTPERTGEGKQDVLIIREVKTEGNLVFPLSDVQKKLKGLKSGKRFSYGDYQQAVDNLVNFYKQKGYLGAVITPDIRYEAQGAVLISIEISPGEPLGISFSGDPLPRKLRKRITDSWNGRLTPDQVTDDARARILDHLHSKNYYDAEVRAEVGLSAKGRTVNFKINRGDRYRIRKFELSGDPFFQPSEVEQTIKQAPSLKARGLWVLVYDFRQAKAALETYYEDSGFLQAEILPPRISVDREQSAIDLTLEIEAGLRSRVRSVEFGGNEAFRDEDLHRPLKLVEESITRLSLLTDDRSTLLNLYRSKGYLDVEVDAEITQAGGGPDIGIRYIIREGAQHTISEVEITGNYRTPDSFIRRELTFKTDEPLNLASLAMSQKNLYERGIFRNVNIYSQPLNPDENEDKVIVDIQEDQMFSVAYGLRYNSEEKFEGFGELSLSNLFGRGRQAVLYYRQNDRQKDFRFSLGDPYLFGKKFNTLYSFFSNREDRESFITDTLGLSFQQQLGLPLKFSLSYLYRLNQIHTYELEPIGPFIFDITLFLSELSAFLVRDTRDKKLDSRQGSFFSLSFTYSPSFLGSDLTFISFFSQYSLYLPLPLGFVWTSNYRLGLADAFDQVLIPSRRFYAGGSHSVRGFKQDRVGPIDPFLDVPDGGEALFVMNQELRFPVFKWLTGVAFYDTGNVFGDLRDLDFLDMRHALGLGVRLNTPVALVRLDCGFPLGRRWGEPGGVFYLSIGQAF